MHLKIVMAMILVFSGCEMDVAENEQDDDGGGRIVDVPNSAIEKQSIGNCWIYAISGFASSMHLAATGQEVDISESYWTYISWFDQIVSYGFSADKIRTGGSWEEAKRLIGEYGLMAEGDFIGADSWGEASYAQSRAQAAVDAALGAGGELSTAEARANQVLVRKVLDRAFGLTPEMQQTLDKVFGQDMSLRFTTGADEAGTSIINPEHFVVQYTNGYGESSTTDPTTQNLVSALDEWREIRSRVTSRAVTRRVQQALHDRQPVLLSWMVDFDAFDQRNGSFKLDTWNTNFKANGKPGRQGGHMTVLEDYQVQISAGTDAQELSASVEKGQFFVFPSIEVPEGPVTVKMSLQDGQSVDGDADLHVRMGGEVSAAKYDCRPYKAGSNEVCSAKGPGLLSIGVSIYSAATAVKIEVLTSAGTRVLEAGKTLDPNDPEDAALLEAALSYDAELMFFRVKNSWGTGVAKGFHDIYMNYLNGPIADAARCSATNCPKSMIPLMSFVLPPGY
ncbi:MAG: PPC domain-containing protein [Myxococcota bacterium]|jgi:hypothetical protein|nr:PPC domain-containing protein [Myxococcota bacterium]